MATDKQKTMNEHSFVVVRPRPSVHNENNAQNTFSLSKDNDKMFYLGEKSYYVDKVFDEDSTQEDIFEEVKPIMEHVKKGFNGIIFAYGQTGTGKTYTMGIQKRNNTNDIMETSDGIAPRVIKHLFEEYGQESMNEIFVSFIEVYNEQIFDLLTIENDKPKKATLDGLSIKNLNKIKVSNEIEALNILEKGIDLRRKCSTQVNQQSSRSHAIYSFYLHCSTGNDKMTSSTLHLVDLAGSESLKKTGNEGIAKQEGININKGLLTLRNVFKARAEKLLHIPFRESVLTSVLRESLNGESYITIIACISQSIDDTNEAINTIEFIKNAKKVKNQPKIHAHTDYKRRTYKTPWKGHQKRSPGGIRKPLRALNYSPTMSKVNFNSRSQRSSLGSSSLFNASHSTSVFSLKSYENSSLFGGCSAENMQSFDQDTIQSFIEKAVKRTAEETVQTVVETLKALKVNSFVADSSINLDTVKSLLSNISPNDNLDNTVINIQSPTVHENAEVSTKQTAECGTSPLLENAFESERDVSVIENSMVSKSSEKEKKNKRRSLRIQNLYQPTMDQTEPIMRRKLIKPSENQLETSPIEKIEKRQSRGRKSMQLQSLCSDVSNGAIPKKRRSMRIQELQLLSQTTINQNEQSTTPKKRRSMRLQDFQMSSQNELPKTNKRRSMRIQLLGNNYEESPNMTLKQQRRSRLSLSKSLLNSTMNTTINLSPSSQQLLNDMRPVLAGKKRTSKRNSVVDFSTQTSPDKEAEPVLIKGRRKSVLNELREQLVVPSPTSGNVQEKHYKNILNYLNTQNLRGLQQLPTVGPKTAFILFNYRKLKGKFSSLSELENIGGLPNSYYKRFMQANNLKP